MFSSAHHGPRLTRDPPHQFDQVEIGKRHRTELGTLNPGPEALVVDVVDTQLWM